MRHPFDGVEREPDTGAIILGRKDSTCIWCGAEAEATYAGNGKVAWWHAPLDCCDRRRAQLARAAARDQQPQGRSSLERSR